MRPAAGQVEANLAHHFEDLRMDALAWIGAGGAALAAQHLPEGLRHLGPASIVDTDEQGTR